MRLKLQFDELESNFNKLKKKLVPQNSISDNLYPVFLDLAEKLNQLWLLYEEMELNFLDLFQKTETGFKNKNLDTKKDWIRLKSKVEAIYYLSHRIKKIFNKEIPGFKNFDPIGIRNIRNHYFEHPKKKYSVNKSINSSGPTFGTQVYKMNKNGNWIKTDSEYCARIYPDLREFIIELDEKIKHKIDYL